MSEIPNRPLYNKALAALSAAHEACFKSPLRTGAVSMSHGPFSGVNEVLGLVDEIEHALTASTAREAALREALEKLIDVCETMGNFKSGTSENGIDEGESYASGIIEEASRALKSTAA